MLKSVKLIIFLLLAASMLFGCGNQGENQQEQIETEGAHHEAPKPDKLTIWSHYEEAQVQALEEITNKYTEETGIKVEVVPVSIADQLDMLALDGPAGRGPDLFYQPHDHTGNIALQGLASPLDFTEEELAGFAEEAIEAFTFNGELYALPYVIETYALLYNRDLIEEAPQTMDELKKIMGDFTDPSSDQYGFVMQATNFYFVYPFISGYGGYVFGRDENGFIPDDIGLANEGAIEGAKLIQSWFENGYMSTALDYDIMGGLFKEEKIAVVVNGPWAIPDYLSALGDKLASAPLPLLPNGEYPSSFIGVKGWMLSAYSEHQEWAKDLMLFLAENENMLTYYEKSSEMPPKPLLLSQPIIAGDPLMVGFAEQTSRGEPMPNIPEMSQVWEPMADALQFIAQGDDPEEVLAEAVEQIEQRISLMGQ